MGDAGSVADLGWDPVAGLNDGSAFGGVADDVAFVSSPAGSDTGQQGGSEVTDRRVVVESAFDDESMVFGGELGVCWRATSAANQISRRSPASPCLVIRGRVSVWPVWFTLGTLPPSDASEPG